MTDKPFLLWSVPLAGWFTKTATYSSEVADARRFTQLEAATLCEAHKRDGKLGLIPVREEDIRAVLGDALS